MQTAISYVRVSTEKQGRSGLGIEAQRNAIARFADAEGFDLIDEFVEVALSLWPSCAVSAAMCTSSAV
jgi:DNA invertase Pin-like site-specific DNA recombinase